MLENGLTKEHSKMLQGIAILLMIYHHLFGVLLNGYTHVLNLLTPNINIELQLAHFGKICVAIYAVISGYGIYMSHSGIWNADLPLGDKFKKSYKRILKSIWGFYKMYWQIFLIMVPLGILLGKQEFNIKNILSDFIGLTYTYNSSWWYVHQYIAMLALYPIIVWGIDNIFDRVIKSTVLLIGAISAAAAVLIIPNTRALLLWFININCISYLIVFIAGIIAAKYKIYQRFESLCKGLGADNMFINILILSVSIVIRLLITDDQMDHQLDAILAPIFIYGMVKMIRGERLKRIFMFFGKYSMQMWLIHCFVCLFWWKGFILSLQISTVMYIVTVGISYIISALIVKFWGGINVVCSKLIKKGRTI